MSAKYENHLMESSEYSNALSIGRTYSFPKNVKRFKRKILDQNTRPKYERKNMSAECGNHLMDPFNFPLHGKVV